jgi:hypothetical protein
VVLLLGGGVEDDGVEVLAGDLLGAVADRVVGASWTSWSRLPIMPPVRW